MRLKENEAVSYLKLETVMNNHLQYVKIAGAYHEDGFHLVETPRFGNIVIEFITGYIPSTFTFAETPPYNVKRNFNDDEQVFSQRSYMKTLNMKTLKEDHKKDIRKNWKHNPKNR